jgi:hypothetical protein
MIAFKVSLSAILLVCFMLVGPLFMAACSQTRDDRGWQFADRSSAGLAPKPEQHEAAVLQIYGARAYSWRGHFAVHTWIATKAQGQADYEVHEVVGWGYDKVRSRSGEPDRAWYGNRPALLADIRGERAEAMIPQVVQAIQDYPYRYRYQAWPGPNSNTFVAWVIRQVPDLRVALPNNAIGKDYLVEGFIAETPTGTGYQFSLWGTFGLLLSVREGFELNVLGLSLGVDPLALAIKLPGVGQIGFADPWIDGPPGTTGSDSQSPADVVSAEPASKSKSASYTE